MHPIQTFAGRLFVLVIAVLGIQNGWRLATSGGWGYNRFGFEGPLWISGYLLMIVSIAILALLISHWRDPG